jgi:hypothetical protein
MPVIDTHVTVSAARDGVIDAIAGWFDAELAPGVHMSNAPTAVARLDRRVVALPVSPAISVRQGDCVSIAVRLLMSDHVFRWRVHRSREGEDPATFDGSTLQGSLISREDLARFE